MPRTSARGGPQTRARIAEVASGLFLEHGFDAVTVADVAREAGVSSVTVFKHFPRKEDLFLDRSADAVELIQAATKSPDVLTALHETTLRLVDERHPLSGVDERTVPFFRTVASSPALLARAREIAYELQELLATETGDDLLAAFFVSGYSTVLVETAKRLISTQDQPTALVDDARLRFERLFLALRSGVAG